MDGSAMSYQQSLKEYEVEGVEGEKPVFMYLAYNPHLRIPRILRRSSAG